ncbi:MAG: prephenate dehydrogenase [Chloroflexota bacterium]
MAAGSFQRIAIIGTGLIGASLGMAIREALPGARLTGFELGADAQKSALRLKAVDSFAPSVAHAVRDADLVIVATPVRTIELIFREMRNDLAPGVLVTDTASTKAQVLRWAAEILPASTSFVGGHPMTGRLTSGSGDPVGTLFQQTVFCVVPSASALSPLVQQFVSLTEAIGAVPYFVDPDEHDGLVAGISHLPYLVSSALMRCVAEDQGWREMRTLAAGGFAAATQLAAGNPGMYTDICLTNREPVLRQLDRYIEQLHRLRGMIEQNDEAMLNEFTAASQARQDWLTTQSESTDGTPLTADLRGPSIFSAGKLGELIRGKRTER